MQKRRPGSILLKVTGILMIIGGSCSLLLAGVSLFGINILLQYYAGTGKEFLTVLSIIIAFIGSILELIAGILGVKSSGSPEKSHRCIIVGIITLITAILGQVVTFLYGNAATLTNITSVVLGIGLPVLYLVGALRNRRM